MPDNSTLAVKLPGLIDRMMRMDILIAFTGKTDDTALHHLSTLVGMKLGINPHEAQEVMAKYAKNVKQIDPELYKELF